MPKLSLRKEAKYDEMLRLRTHAPLFLLLDHYARLDDIDGKAWHDRLMHMNDAQARELVKLHGELLAHQWIEPNTGTAREFKAGVVSSCYRITPAGRRAWKEVEFRPADESGPAD